MLVCVVLPQWLERRMLQGVFPPEAAHFSLPCVNVTVLSCITLCIYMHVHDLVPDSLSSVRSGHERLQQ